jgi:hypothetical protein
MNDNRKIGTYMAKGVTKVRPMGTWWGGDPEKPQAHSNRKVWVHDPNLPETPQDLHVTEAEKLYGMKADQTAAPGVSSLERIRCISVGWDINIVKMLFGTIFKDNDSPQPSPSGHDNALGGHQVQMDIQEVDKFSNSATILRSMGKLIMKESWTIHISKAESYAILPSGEQVTLYLGHDNALGDHQVQMDTQDVDKSSNSATIFLSMDKLIREASWTIHMSKAESYAILPKGKRVTLYFNKDKVLCLKYDTRTGRKAMKIPSSTATLAGMIKSA